MYVAEYLPRLNRISVKLSYEESVKDIRKLNISNGDGGNYLLVGSQLKSYKVHLPYQADPSQLQITGVNLLLGILSMSLEVPTKTQKVDTSISQGSFMNLVDSSLQKWSIKDLLGKTPKNHDNVNVFSFACGQCGFQIIDSTNVNKFIDMPSELWYEMMDFWHCHKPHDHNHNHDEKNYNGNLKPSLNDVFVGTSYLLINSKRGYNVSCPGGSAVVCSKCQNKLGEKVEEDSWKLFKWNLKLQYGEEQETYPLYLVVYYLILEKINSSATRKFVVSSNKQNLVIWVVGIGLNVTTESYSLENCLKVLYNQWLDKVDDNNVETLEVEQSVFLAVCEWLQKINGELPESTRSLAMTEDSETINREISYL